MHEFQSKKVGDAPVEKRGDAVPLRPRPTTPLTCSYSCVETDRISTDIARHTVRLRLQSFFKFASAHYSNVVNLDDLR